MRIYAFKEIDQPLTLEKNDNNNGNYASALKANIKGFDELIFFYRFNSSTCTFLTSVSPWALNCNYEIIPDSLGSCSICGCRVSQNG